ncbi:MAG: tetratricopeptide repeat protein [Myxococcaceae bacterium]
MTATSRILIIAAFASASAFSGCAGESHALRKELVELRAEMRATRLQNEQLEKRVQRMEDRRAVEAAARKDTGKEPSRDEAPVPELEVVKLKPSAAPAPKIEIETSVQEPDDGTVELLLTNDSAPEKAGAERDVGRDAQTTELFAEAAYGDGMQALKTGNVRGAVLKLQEFVTTYPRHARADNALYYSGIGLLGLDDYENAATAFERVLAEYPAGDARIESMLKLADCRLKLNQRDRASDLYAKLINTYPGTTAAQEARARLDKITQ